MSCPLRLSTIEAEGVFRCAKWVSHTVLFSLSGLQELLTAINPYFLLPMAEPVAKERWCISQETLLEQYKRYLEEIKSSAALPAIAMRRFFSLTLTSSLEDVYAVSLAKERIFIKPRRPVIQIQLYRCYLSPAGEFHPMILHPDSFSWGLQFSYPQIYEDPHTHQFFKVLLESEFNNTRTFKSIVSWIRTHTKPVPLSVKEKVLHAPFRIEKKSENPLLCHLGLQQALNKLGESCISVRP